MKVFTGRAVAGQRFIYVAYMPGLGSARTRVAVVLLKEQWPSGRDISYPPMTGKISELPSPSICDQRVKAVVHREYESLVSAMVNCNPWVERLNAMTLAVQAAEADGTLKELIANVRREVR